jgi:hypothetical protein
VSPSSFKQSPIVSSVSPSRKYFVGSGEMEFTAILRHFILAVSPSRVPQILRAAAAGVGHSQHELRTAQATSTGDDATIARMAFQW